MHACGQAPEHRTVLGYTRLADLEFAMMVWRQNLKRDLACSASKEVKASVAAQQVSQSKRSCVEFLALQVEVPRAAPKEQIAFSQLYGRPQQSSTNYICAILLSSPSHASLLRNQDKQQLVRAAYIEAEALVKRRLNASHGAWNDLARQQLRRGSRSGSFGGGGGSGCAPYGGMRRSPSSRERMSFSDAPLGGGPLISGFTDESSIPYFLTSSHRKLQRGFHMLAASALTACSSAARHMACCIRPRLL